MYVGTDGISLMTLPCPLIYSNVHDRSEAKGTLNQSSGCAKDALRPAVMMLYVANWCANKGRQFMLSLHWWHAVLLTTETMRE